MKLLIKSILFFFKLSLQKPVCILCLNHISSHTNPILRAQYSVWLVAAILVGGAFALRGKEEQGLTVGGRRPPGQEKDTDLEDARGRGWGPLQRPQDGHYEGAQRGRSDTKHGDSRGPSGGP